MKKGLSLAFIVMMSLVVLLTGCGSSGQEAEAAENRQVEEENSKMQMKVQVGGSTFTAALEENEFTVLKQIEHSDNFIFGNINLLKRIINNIFSNVSKYANKNEPINIELTTDDNNLKFTVKNTKIHTVDYIESNCIGLKSVKQMMKIHDGNLTIIDDKSYFTIIITFPLIK